MNETISRKSTALLALFAFVFGLVGFASFHYVNDASADSSQEETQDDNENTNNSVVIEREAPQPEPTQAPPTSISTSDYLVPEVATRQYTRVELETLDNYQLYLARNEIFARHGMIFSEKYSDLRNYFSQKSWYQPIYTRDEWIALEENGYKQLNATENSNAELMLEIEKSRNSPYIH